ncbi:MAG: glycosyltransferase family 2 protein [Candidatus Omnitrophota bacterium]
MKISVITSVYNNEACIEGCVKSVLDQTYKDIEYIVVEGGSTDGTPMVINKYRDSISILVSGRDRGMYDALNKGIKLASGDVIGILNADDLYVNENVIQEVMNAFDEHGTDSVYGDLVYVSKEDSNKVIRYWKAGTYKRELLKKGWMVPHPTFFVKRSVYEKYGYFDTNFKISADYEIILRFLYMHGIATHYIPKVLVKMCMGGVSNRGFRNIIIKSIEDYRAWKIYGINKRLFTIAGKNIMKIPQFFLKRFKE